MWFQNAIGSRENSRARTSLHRALDARHRADGLVEVVVIVLYTGPMFVLYNGILRDFGTCGAVPADVEFGSAEFWELLKKVDVSDRMTKAGHKFPTTLHVLASAIKKLQVRSPVSVPLCV